MPFGRDGWVESQMREKLREDVYKHLEEKVGWGQECGRKCGKMFSNMCGCTSRGIWNMSCNGGKCGYEIGKRHSGRRRALFCIGKVVAMLYSVPMLVGCG